MSSQFGCQEDNLTLGFIFPTISFTQNLELKMLQQLAEGYFM